ncbi:hypothetical protein [Marivita sp. S0852]|uniref:hypothetical protein n=1 Tax=Marivita sp. S0852 TaxID=3373893 RepID=UPI0039829950
MAGSTNGLMDHCSMAKSFDRQNIGMESAAPAVSRYQNDCVNSIFFKIYQSSIAINPQDSNQITQESDKSQFREDKEEEKQNHTSPNLRQSCTHTNIDTSNKSEFNGNTLGSKPINDELITKTSNELIPYFHNYAYQISNTLDIFNESQKNLKSVLVLASQSEGSASYNFKVNIHQGFNPLSAMPLESIEIKNNHIKTEGIIAKNITQTYGAENFDNSSLLELVNITQRPNIRSSTKLHFDLMNSPSITLENSETIDSFTQNYTQRILNRLANTEGERFSLAGRQEIANSLLQTIQPPESLERTTILQSLQNISLNLKNISTPHASLGLFANRAFDSTQKPHNTFNSNILIDAFSSGNDLDLRFYSANTAVLDALEKHDKQLASEMNSIGLSDLSFSFHGHRPNAEENSKRSNDHEITYSDIDKNSSVDISKLDQKDNNVDIRI